MEFNESEDTIEISLDEISKSLIQNRELDRYVKFLIGKNVVTSKDLETIAEIILDSKTINKQNNFVYFDDLKLFPNLKSICLFNLGITKNETKLMKENNKIEELSLNNCSLYDGLDNLENLRIMSIVNSNIECIDEIERLSNLEEMVIENSKFDNYDFLKNLKNLKTLYFMNMNESELKLLPELDNLEFLSLAGIDKFSCDNLDKFKNLKTLSIGKMELDELSEVIDSVEKKGIKIFIEDAYDGI